MKAAILEGVNLALELKEVETPVPGPGEYRVRLHAAALNHRDVWIRKGMYAGLKFPIILGSDGAGVIESAGDGADPGRVGNSVLINPSHNWGEHEGFQGEGYRILGLPENGTFAEYVCVPAEYVHDLPLHLGYQSGASLPLGGLTAYRALFSRANLRSGEKVLVTGAGGGVALFAITFALAAGAEVWVTSGHPEKIDQVVSMGVAGGVNYKNENWRKELAEKAGEFHVIVDSAGGSSFGELVKLAAPGGRIVLYGGTTGNWEKVSPQIVFWKQLSILGTTMGSPHDFSEMLRFVSEKKIMPVVDEVFPLENAQEALDKLASGVQVGKVVLKIS